MRRDLAEPMRQGRDAAMQGGEPYNPYRSGTQRWLYWQWGYDRATRLLAQIMEIGK